MYTTGLVFTTLLALSANAAPVVPDVSSDVSLAPRDETFNLHVYNNCPFVKEVGITATVPVGSDGTSSVTDAAPASGSIPALKMIAKSDSVNIEPGTEHVFTPNYHDVGLRLSGHMEWGLDGQWQPQVMLEFGYSGWSGVEGTAYDISMMLPVPDQDIGMKVEPIDNGQGSGSCDTKLCYPGDANDMSKHPLNQCWTNPDQTMYKNPADTVCYQGKSDFKVTYCP